MFALVVDRFGVKVNSEQQATHLINALQDEHEIDVDYTGSLHVGVTLKLNHNERVMEHSITN